MKKTLLIVLALVMLISVTACAPKLEEEPIDVAPPTVDETPEPTPTPVKRRTRTSQACVLTLL